MIAGPRTTVVYDHIGLDAAHGAWLIALLAVGNALLGMALGLFVSAFATTEFQAVQFMPAVVLPQFLLCGLLVPRDELGTVLEAISWALRCPVGLGSANVLEIRPLTEMTDIPPALLELSQKVAPAWTASVTGEARKIRRD